jgi:phytoene dehydrogenase-like protein
MSADVVVIGAGTNGLTAAALLAKGGRKVVVLERRGMAGGLAAAEEFHPGYRTAGVLHDTSGLHPGVVDALRLTEHGLALAPEPAPVLGLLAGRAGSPGLLLHHDPDKAADAIRAHAPGDADAYRAFRAFVNAVGPIVRRFRDTVPPDPADFAVRDAGRLLSMGFSLRRLGKETMMDVLRVAPMCVADWLNEQFTSDVLKMTLAPPALLSTFAGPWSPGTAANLLIQQSIAGRWVQGGPAALAGALERAAAALGVTVRTDAAVERILVSKGTVTGVHLQGGEEIAAAVVAASCDPRHAFLDLVDSRDIPHRLEHAIRHVRGRGVAARVSLAVTGPVAFASGGASAVSRFRIGGPDFDAMERTFDPVKYGELGTALTLDGYIPTVEDPALAPQGHSVITVLATSVPYAPAGGWTDALRNRVGDRVVAALAEHAPDLPSRIAGREVLAPPDLEARYGAVQGHLHHGDHALDQVLIRPVPECSRYRTPLEGLYLCGGGSHPGGGVTCAPGSLAAGVILAG